MTVVQLDARRSRTVGGSDCAAAAGVHPYVSPVMLWAQKTGRIEAPVTEAMRWGALLEPVIIDRLRDEWTVLPADGYRLDSPHEWASGHPDGFVLIDGSSAVLEVKTANQWAHASWEGVPVEYQAQCQWYMNLTGCASALFAVLIAGQRLEVHTLLRDDRAIELLMDAAERFVWHLTTDTPPPPDGSQSTRDALLALHPEAERGMTVRLLGDDWTAVRELRNLRRHRDDLDDLIVERENRIKAAMGDAEVAISPHDEEVIRWANVTTRRVDTTALKHQRPHIADLFTTETTSRRFTVR